MEDKKYYIYYKINSSQEYKSIEIENKDNFTKLSKETIKQFFIKSEIFTDIEFNLIKEIKYGIDKTDNLIYLKDEDEIILPNNFDKIYIHFIIGKYIYYKINDNPDYYIIELENDDNYKSFTWEKLKDFLVDDGFDKEKLFLINNIRYRFNEKSKLEELTNDNNIELPEDFYIIYIQFGISDDETKADINNEYDDYQSKLKQLKKEIEDLSKENFNKNNNNNIKNSGLKNYELSEEDKKIKIYGINQNINTNSNLNNKGKINIKNDNNNKDGKPIKLYYVYSYPLVDNDKINQNNFNNNSRGVGLKLIENVNLQEKKNIKMENNINDNNVNNNVNNNLNNIVDNKVDNIINNNVDNINNDNNNNMKKNDIINEDYIYYEQIFTIKKIFEEKNIYANLNFEPINENFNTYIEQGPDILHIKVNSFIKNKIKNENDENNENINDDEREKNINNLFINLDLDGQSQKYSCEDLRLSFQIEDKVSEIKLLILSTQNIKEMQKIFKDIPIKNIIYINSSGLNEEEENNFIRNLYQNMLNGYTIGDSFNKSKKNNNNEILKLIPFKENDDKIKICLKEKDKNEIINNENENKNKNICLNSNCSLNLDYMKNNFKIVMGRNKELKDCYTQLKKNNKICVYGYEGVGKKSFVQKLGYYLYERNLFDIYYLELFSLDDLSKNILKLKIEEIKYIINQDKDNENKIDYDIKKILIIVYFNFVIKRENLKNLEQLINESNNNYYFLYTFTINQNIENIKKKKIINFSSIILDEVDKEMTYKILNKILKKPNLNINEKTIKEIFEETKGCPNQRKYGCLYGEKKDQKRDKEQKEEKKCEYGCNSECPYNCPNGCPKKTPNTPNDIYLRALYINLFSDKIKNNEKIESKRMSNINILLDILDYKDRDKKYKELNIKKIFAIFSILKFGINEDILEYLLKGQKKFIDDYLLNYIIFKEKNENETLYFIDSSFSGIIIRILQRDKNEKELIDYLELILKYYALIFRYLVNYSKFPYDISCQFHPGIKNEFWNKASISFKKEYEDFEQKKPKIFFDDVVYSNNVYNLFSYKTKLYDKIIAKKQQIDLKQNSELTKNVNIYDIFKEYIYHIAICLPTILHFKNSFLYRNLILDGFFNSIRYYDIPIEYAIRIKMLKYWITEKSKFLQFENVNFKSDNTIIEEKEDKKEDSNENKIEKNKKEKMNADDITKIEYYLIKIYESIIKKQNEDISNIFVECGKLIKNNDYINRVRLNMLYGIYTNDKNLFEEAEKNAELYAKETNNIYLKLKAKLMTIEYLVRNNEFDKYDNYINEVQEEKKKYINKDISLMNSDIEDNLLNLEKLKNNLFNNYIKNKLFFFMSNPFYDENGNELKTVSNNNFYLKYKLMTIFPNLQFEFQKIASSSSNFENLEKCLNYPIKFIYIGSDHYNDKGNLFCENKDNNFKSQLIVNEDLKNIIDKSNCKESCDIVILGVLNNDDKDNNSLFNIFKSNNFRHIIYIRKIDKLNKCFEENPVFYQYFQQKFLIFIKEFILNLNKSRGCLTIKEAFRRANNNFNDNIKKIKKIKEILKEDKKDTILDIEGKEENDNDIFDFGLFNDENFNEPKNFVKKISKNVFDEIDDDDEIKKNNIYFRKNPFTIDIPVKEDYNSEEKKKLRYIKLPMKNINDENFKNFLDMRVYLKKNILEDIINLINKNQYINVYGNEQINGKKRICQEVCKYLYMNNYFKKGIFIIDLKYFKKIRNIPELKSRLNNQNKNSNPRDMLLVLMKPKSHQNSETPTQEKGQEQYIESIKISLIELLKILNVHVVIITNRKLNEDLSSENNDTNENVIYENKISDINENKHKKHKKEEEDEKILKDFIEKMKFYNIDKETDNYKSKHRNYDDEYKKYRELLKIE